MEVIILSCSFMVSQYEVKLTEVFVIWHLSVKMLVINRAMVSLMHGYVLCNRKQEKNHGIIIFVHTMLLTHLLSKSKFSLNLGRTFVVFRLKNKKKGFGQRTPVLSSNWFCVTCSINCIVVPHKLQDSSSISPTGFATVQRRRRTVRTPTPQPAPSRGSPWPQRRKLSCTTRRRTAQTRIYDETLRRQRSD